MEDISMAEPDYNWALSIFFIGYVSFLKHAFLYHIFICKVEIAQTNKHYWQLIDYFPSPSKFDVEMDGATVMDKRYCKDIFKLYYRVEDEGKKNTKFAENWK